MQRSEHRILTTHAGSLPRPAALTRLYAQRVARRADRSGRDRARRPRCGARDRAEAGRTGLDVIDDGEQSRESFVLYMRHRLTGLGGEGTRAMHADLDDYPQYKARFQARVTSPDRVSNRAQLPKAIGPVAYADRARSKPNAPTSAPRWRRQGRYVEGVPHRAVARHHRVDRAERALRRSRRYLDALGAALQVEYEAIVAHGFLLQLDCPDLALERHTSYRDRPLADFVDFVERVVAAINKALRNIPRDKVRLHVCWGNYEGPHDRDVALRDILPAILPGEGRGVLPAVRQSAPCARVPLFERHAAGRRPAAHRRRDRYADQLRRAPGGRRRPHRAHRRGGRRRARAGRRPIAASTPPPAWAASPRTSCGRSCARCARARELASKNLFKS